MFYGRYADPYATGIASWHAVKGLRDSGVQALAKHFIGYEQETFRYRSFCSQHSLA
jgi:beta-glucosidase